MLDEGKRRGSINRWTAVPSIGEHGAVNSCRESSSSTQASQLKSEQKLMRRLDEDLNDDEEQA